MLATPIGALNVTFTLNGDSEWKLVSLRWPTAQLEKTSIPLIQLSGATMSPIRAAINKAMLTYFTHGDDAALKALPLELQGTPFQQEVWQACQLVPLGETLSYGLLAKRIGKSGAAQAVGQALKVNPWPLIVPCHRIVGHGFRPQSFQSANGHGLGGYMGQMASPIKQALLAHESWYIAKAANGQNPCSG